MNDIYAQRLARTMMFQQLFRTHGTLWAATQVTKEPLDFAFVEEEFMRVNGKRAMPLLVGAAARHNLHHSHLCQLSDNFSWTESAKGFAVRHQTPLSQRAAAIGRMEQTITTARASSASQLLLNEHLHRIDGITEFDEEPVLPES